jgi:hypothetical protein
MQGDSMPHGVVRELIPAPSAEVFRLLHDYGRRLEWDTLLKKAYLTDGNQEARVGAVCVCKARTYLGGVALKTKYVSFRPPEVAAVRMINRPAFFESFAATIRHRELSASSSSVEYTYHFAARPRWLRFVLHPIMATLFALETRRRLRALRRFFERHHPAAAVRPGLYERILKGSWEQLDEAVRRLHAEGTVVRVAGTFRIRHGAGRLVRLLAWLARLPAAGEAVDVGLTITPLEHGEEWRRTFAGRPLVSAQYQRGDTLLAERVGLLEMRLRLAVANGTLFYKSVSAALRLGPLRLRLPGWVTPRLTAREQPDGDRNGVYVSIEMSLPLLGLLVAYEGPVSRIEALAGAADYNAGKR